MDTIKRWHYQEFSNADDVTAYLNKLSMAGVESSNIKLCVGGRSNWAHPAVHYFHHERIHKTDE